MSVTIGSMFLIASISLIHRNHEAMEYQKNMDISRHPESNQMILLEIEQKVEQLYQQKVNGNE